VLLHFFHYMSEKTSKITRGAYPDLPRIAVGAIVFKDGKVLLVRRAKPPSEGLWAIPGGSVNLGETLQQAAEREIFEETGAVIRAKQPVFTFDVIEKDEYNRIRFHYVIVDLKADYISGNLCSGDDAIEVRWVAPEQLQDLNVSSHTVKVLKLMGNFF